MRISDRPLNELMADEIYSVFGLDAGLDPSDPDFWMKHDRAKHGGHFDPERQTCKLREEAKAEEKKQEKIDEDTDLSVSEAPDRVHKIIPADKMLIGTKIINLDRDYAPSLDNPEFDTKELHDEKTDKVVGLYDRATNTVKLFEGADIHTLVHELGGHATMQFAQQCAEAGNDMLLNKINESIDTAPKNIWNEVREKYQPLKNESDEEYNERLRDEVWAAVVEGKSKAIEEAKQTEKGQKWWKKAWNTVKACWAGVLGRMGVQVDWASDKVKNMSPSEFQEFIVNSVKEGRTLGSIRKGGEGAGTRQMAKIGIRPDGIEIYKSDARIRNLPLKERKRLFREMMERTYAGRTARFTKNGRVFYATFEKEDIRKNIHGDKQSDRRGREAKTNAGASGDMFDIVEQAQYQSSKPETGKSGTAHKDVKTWDYFDKRVEIDGEEYDVLINVRDKGNNQFVYNIALRERKKSRVKGQPLKQYALMSDASNSTQQSISNNAEEVKSPRSSVVKISMGQDAAEHRMVEFRDLLAKKFPNKDATSIISELGKIKSAKEQKAYLKRVLKGNRA